MKIVHLSDTHCGRDDNERRLQALLDDIAAHCDPAQHVLVHTGDLIDRAQATQRTSARAQLDRFAARGWRVLLAPGNHDYGDSWHVSPEGARAFQRTFAPYLWGTDGAPPSSAQQPGAPWPVLTLLGECAFIGLDSNAAELGFWERWMAEGSLGLEQIAALSRLLDDSALRGRTVVVYLHHHPFLDAAMVRPDVGDGAMLRHFLRWHTRRFRRLKDAYSLLQTLRDRAHCLLFGHQHYGLDYSAEARRYGLVAALDASSSTALQMDTDRMRYRIIEPRTGQYETRLVAFPR